jgi:hypothetical protein
MNHERTAFLANAYAKAQANYKMLGTRKDEVERDLMRVRAEINAAFKSRETARIALISYVKESE